MALESAVRHHDYNLRATAKAAEHRIEIMELDLGGGCLYRWSNGSQQWTGAFALDIKRRGISYSCACPAGGGCVHTAAAVTYLLEQLNKPGSDLEVKLLGSTLSERRLAQQLDRLGHYARRISTIEQPRRSPMDLMSGDAPQTRYFWNLTWEASSRRLSLRPVQTTEKKTGGWTRGRELTLESFLTGPRDGWTELEQGLEALFRTDFDFFAALRLLKDSDRFWVEREPGIFEEKQLELFVTEEEHGGLRVLSSAVRDHLEQDGVVRAVLVGVPGGILALAHGSPRVTAYRGPNSSSQLLQELIPPPTFPYSMRVSLLKSLQILSGIMPVHFPESVAGEMVREEMKPAVLMCLRRTSGLDMSVVMEDARGEVYFPGEGVLMRTEEAEGGIRRQLIRDADAEVRAGTEVQRELGLGQGRSVQMGRWLHRIADVVESDRVLADAARLVSEGRLKVLWHRDSANQMHVIGRLTPANVRISVSRQRDWFGVQGGCVIGDTEISLKDLLGSLGGRTSGGLVEVSPGKWALMADELRTALVRLADVSHESRGKLQLDTSAAGVMTVLERAQIRTESDKHWKKCLERLAKLEEICPDPPAGLKASLRDYQVDGFRWLSRLAHWGIGGILADDMGLGKTVQTLALLLTRAETGPALVIAPTSLGFNWQRECERFAPSMRAILFRESDRVELKNQVGKGDLVICSYGLALREAELLKEIDWGTLVLDEAQNIKNSASKTAAAVRSLSAQWKLALTGTPMENHLGELWSIFHTIAPGVLGSWEQFRRRFASPIERERNPERRDGLARVISPFVLRRSKGEVLKDLPARTETNLMVELSPEERRRYDQMRLAAVTELDSLGEQLSQDQRFRVLQILTRLRQLSCHVGLVDESWTGSSSKLELLMERLGQLKERGSRALVFSQFTSHLELIRRACEESGISYKYLDGQTTPAQRRDRVEAFQGGEGDVFLISLKAGGTGLNLTAADYVIHMDPWWNPAVEDQATDRTHRIGQTKPVMVYRIIARGTIEEKILSLHEEKRDLVDGVLAGADAAGRLSTTELADLIRQGPEGVGV
jgi:superfamily II DNA or RNA helicase